MLVKLKYSKSPGLSRTLNFNIQEFPGPGNFKKNLLLSRRHVNLATMSMQQYARPTASRKISSELDLLPHTAPCQRGQINSDILYPSGARHPGGLIQFTSRAQRVLSLHLPSHPYEQHAQVVKDVGT